MTTLPNFLMKRAALTPDRIALEMDDRKVTFRELFRKSTKLSEKIKELGVEKGDRVSIFMSNSIELVELLFALKNCGAITVLHNLRLTAQELSFQVLDADSRYIIVEDGKESILSGVLDQKKIITFDRLASIKGSKFELVQEFEVDATDTIMYTSGTTGSPKGVNQTYGNHFWSATGSALNLGLHENDCWLLAVPMFHISGLSILMRGVVYGMRVIIHKRFDADAVHHDLMEQKVTIISVVSAMLSGLLEKLDSATYPTTFRCMLVGGGPVPKSMLRDCQEKAIPVYQTYGMTETCSQIVTLSPDFALSKLGSAGKPLFPCQLRIVRAGEELACGETGEIVVKGPNVTPGYYNREEATLSSIQDGWLYTGDLGYLDEEGFLFVVDRRSDLIISGGENVYPAEVEAVLVSHPAIKEAGVTGVYDDRWGQVPLAFIVENKAGNFDKKEVLTYLKENLASYKVPKELYLVRELPRNASSKLMRRELLKMVPDERGENPYEA